MLLDKANSCKLKYLTLQKDGKIEWMLYKNPYKKTNQEIKLKFWRNLLKGIFNKCFKETEKQLKSCESRKTQNLRYNKMLVSKRLKLFKKNYKI